MGTTTLQPLTSESATAPPVEPQVRGFSTSLVTLAPGQTAVGEAFRALRTHIMAQHVEGRRRALALCAPSAAIGCTFVASNLAIALSQIGMKTLLIDSNLRNPGLERFFFPSSTPNGLKQCVIEGGHPSDYIVPEVLPDLALMYSGGVVENAQELLATENFSELMGACMRDYDMTIVDTAPANVCSDALRVSTVVGYSLIVVGRNKTLVGDVRVLAGQLEGDGARVVGTVLTES